VCGLGSGSTYLTTAGILYGLGSGIGYAMYSIFGKLAMDRGYSSLTVNFYTTLFASLGALVIWGDGGSLSVMVSSWNAALWCLSAGVVTCYLPYLFYTYGLSGLEVGKRLHYGLGGAGRGHLCGPRFLPREHDGAECRRRCAGACRHRAAEYQKPRPAG
jgi:hypothetical protein